MELGLFMQPLHNPKKRNITEMLEQDREAALYIDKVGFDEIWVGEHYTSAIEPIVNPLQFLASIMADTKMKLATGVLNLPQHHPAQVAGDVALLDHMSKGRVIMGIGPGGLGSDFELFNTMDKNRSEMMLESLSIIHKIWASDAPYNIPGKHWNVKVEDTILEKLGFGPMLKPFQKPYPPVFTSLMSPNSKSAYFAGARGLGIASANFIQSIWSKSHWDQYAAGAESAGLRPDRNKWRVGRSILVTDTDQEAEDYLAQEDNTYAWYYDFVIEDMRTYNIETVLKHDPDMSSDDITLKYCLDTMVTSGSPKTVLDKLVALVDYVGGPFGGLLVGFKEWNDPETEKRSLRLLAQNVMPKLRQYCETKKAA